MSDRWSSSSRRSQLPSNWSGTVVPRILARDGHRCTWTDQGQRCQQTTRLEVDHLGDPLDHADRNLRTLCHDHHQRRTQAQAADARRRTTAQRRRPAEPHPGLKKGGG